MITVLKEFRNVFLWCVFLAIGWASIFGAKYLEVSYFPVVKYTEITETTFDPRDETLLVYLRFTKVRDCEYQKIAWYDSEGHIVDVEFNDNRGSRPPSDNEVGPWRVHLTDLTGSRLYVQHRCHAGWTQWTKMLDLS